MRTMLRLTVLICVVATTVYGQEWQATTKEDPLSGKPYMTYTRTGKFLTPPSNGGRTSPTISLRCDPSAHNGRLSGKLIAGFIIMNAILDLENGDKSTVQYRLDDGKLQTAHGLGYSTDFQAISLDDMFVNNLLWGHMITHKPHSSDQVHKVVIGVQEHLAGQVVMQFDMPDAERVGAACGTEYRK